MRRIAVIEDGYVRDAQIYTGSPNNLDNENFEDSFVDLNNVCQYVGLFEGASESEISAKAAETEGVNPGIITLIDPADPKSVTRCL